NALRQPNTVRDGQALKQLFDALVHVKHAELQVEDWLARHAEQKMARLDDAGMHRTDWHLKHPFTLDLAELVPHTGERRQFDAEVKIFAQRVDLGPVVVQHATARVGMAQQLDAKQILDLPLLP